MNQIEIFHVYGISFSGLFRYFVFLNSATILENFDLDTRHNKEICYTARYHRNKENILCCINNSEKRNKEGERSLRSLVNNPEI